MPDPRPTMLLLHGWGCDRTYLGAQAAAFGRTHRVLAPNLPGHGASPAGAGLSVAAMGDAVAKLCAEADLRRPVVVGHSMGGQVALELAHRHPQIPAALVLIDPALFPPPPLRAAILSLAERMRGTEAASALDDATAALFEPSDDPAVRARYRASLDAAPLPILRRTFEAHLIDYDPAPAAASCRVPAAYVAAQSPLGDVGEIRARLPGVRVGQVLGSGHFAPALVPDQVNAMVADFIRVCVDRG